MKNIWKIFTGDLKKLVKQPFALVIIIGLCVIPSLYAWFNIFANWDPYANTGGIPVAVVSLDQDYTLKDGSVVNMGESVLESLHSNTSVKWIFLDTEEEAKEGVDIRRDVFETVVKNGWYMLELKTSELSLEDIFLKLTMGEALPALENTSDKEGND